MMTLTTGGSGGSSKLIRGRVLHSLSKLGRHEITIPRYVEVAQPAPPKPPLFAGRSDNELLGYWAPPEWLADGRRANQETLLELADHLSSEAAEALLDLATGVAPKVAKPVTVGADPFAHPDAQRRFRVVANVEELERALDNPWDAIAHHLSKAKWSLSNLASMLRHNLFTYRDLTAWLDNPFGTPPQLLDSQQLTLGLT